MRVIEARSLRLQFFTFGPCVTSYQPLTPSCGENHCPLLGEVPRVRQWILAVQYYTISEARDPLLQGSPQLPVVFITTRSPALARGGHNAFGDY